MTGWGDVQNDRVGAAGRKANWRERKKTRAKVVQLLLELLVVLIICPCKGADRRPARSGPPPRRREAKPNCRERNRCSGADRRPARSGPPSRRRLANGQTAASAKKQATFAGIAFLLAQFPMRKSRATFAGIAFLLAQFRERESLQLSLELLVVLIARPCSGADRRPPLMRRPRGAVRRSRTGASAKMRAKVVQLLLELLVS